MFSAIDQVVLRQLPYTDASRLAAIWDDFSQFGTGKQRVSPGTFFDWQRQSRSFSALAAYRSSGLTAAGSGEPEALTGIAATANLLPMLGIQPVAGRLFTADEDTPGSRVVVVSYALWHRRLGGDADAVGRTLRLNDEPYTVVGIMPLTFQFPDRRTDYWVPLGLPPELAARRNSHFLFVVGRLRADRTWDDARTEMGTIAADLAREHSSTNARVGVAIVPLKDEMLGDVDRSLLVLFGAAACVLLIACANAANLGLVRSSRRQHELAVRMALGASRARLAREMLAETALLAGGATAAGLVVARWCLSALQWLVPASAAGTSLRLDMRAIGFASVLAAAAAIIFGIVPALVMSAQSSLRSAAGSGGRVVGHAGGRLREALVVVEIGVALVLLCAAGLLIETLVNLRFVDMGFRAGHVLTASIEAPYPKYTDAVVRQEFFDRIVRAATAIPGVEAAGLTSDLPYTSRGNTMSIRIEGRETEAGLGSDALFRLVSPGYLRTIGAHLQAGRLLDDRDTAGAPPAVVVNESFTRKYFGVADPLGHRIDSGTGGGAPLWMTIVGVVADVRERGADQENRPAMYVPYTQTAIAFFQPSEIAVRTSVPPLSIAGALRQAVWSVDSQQPVTLVRTLDDIVDADVADRREVLSLVAAFSAVALLLAAVGLYSVLSYIVVQSNHEIGVRLAVGATPGAIVGGVLSRAAVLAAFGVIAGLVCSVAATRLLRTLLYEVSPFDARVFGIAAAVVVSVALLSACLPAWRAASTDSLVVLRGE